jgi:hypothetical protein
MENADRLTVFSLTLDVWSAYIQTMDENGCASSASLILRTRISRLPPPSTNPWGDIRGYSFEPGGGEQVNTKSLRFPGSRNQSCITGNPPGTRTPSSRRPSRAIISHLAHSPGRWPGCLGRGRQCCFDSVFRLVVPRSAEPLWSCCE